MSVRNWCPVVSEKVSEKVSEMSGVSGKVSGMSNQGSVRYILFFSAFTV